MRNKSGKTTNTFLLNLLAGIIAGIVLGVIAFIKDVVFH